jgi:plasmid stabilization system protein ParE
VKVEFGPLAIREVFQAADIHAERDPGKSDRFLRDLGQTISLLKDYPLIGEQVVRDSRRFPCWLTYVVDPDVVTIIAVAHMKRWPHYWLRRLCAALTGERFKPPRSDRLTTRFAPADKPS